MAISLVITARPNPAEVAALKQYVEGVMPVLHKNGGQPIKNLKVAGTIYGEPKFHIVSVIDFPSESAARSFFADSSYKALLPMRDRAFVSFDAVIAEDR